jgi:predicted ATPase
VLLRHSVQIPAPSLTVPASLHASLMARLDRLGPAKELAQIGAAIGREFSHTLLAEKAAALWDKAGQRSLERSALVEAVEQLTRSLSQLAALPSTPALRRKQIKLQVEIINPIMHVNDVLSSGIAACESMGMTRGVALGKR